MEKEKKTLEIVKVESLSHEGRGIAHINGKTTFIEGALPGEQVIIRYRKRHARFDEANIEELIEASPHRVIPRCPHFGVCGGCSLQHTDKNYQIYLKEQMLKQHLNHFGNGLEPKEWLPPIQAKSEWGYRRRARLGVRFVAKKNKILVGFREKNSRYLADLTSCEVLDSRVSTLIVPLQNMIQQLTIYEHIPQIEVTVSDQVVSLIFRHLREFSQQDLQILTQFAQDHYIRIYLQPKDMASVHMLWPSNEPFDLSYKLPEHQIEIQFHPSNFIQVNSEINRLLTSKAIELLDLQKNDIVLDLFCGLGNFTLPIARYSQKVIGVEGDTDMTERARKNAKLNQLDNVEFYSANLEDSFSSLPWNTEKFTKLLIDPPRSGALNIAEQIECWPDLKRIVYVSCNPATLARDAGILVHKKGFRLAKAGVIDMFPHTDHVESIAVFEK